MRIAIYHNLPSGGAKRSLYEMTRYLSQSHKIDAYSLSCAEHNFADLRSLVGNYLVFPFSTLPKFRSPFGRLNQLIYLLDLLRLDLMDRSLANKIDNEKYDVVFVHHCRYRQSPGVLRFLRTPTIYYCQEPPRWIYDPPIPRPDLSTRSHRTWYKHIDPLPSLYRYAVRRLDKLNVQGSSRILVNSHHSQENVWRIYGKYPSVCYLGVDTNEFTHVLCQREPIILSVGTINPVKGYDLLIMGIARLPENSRPKLVIISNQSDPQEKVFLERLAENNHVNMQIMPIISDSHELAVWYSRAQITGYTPVLEPLGLVPLESMACETPVVGIREGGVRETVIDGYNGILVDRDPDALADGLSDLLSEPQKALDMGQRGRNWVSQNWTWEKCGEKINQTIKDTIENAAN